MRLADRLFAFRRPPAWTDAVQVLLWLMGWLVVLALLVLLVFVYGPVGQVLAAGGEPGEFGAIFAVAMVAALLITVGAALLGCWFVSEAYRGWRAGHPHGRGWAIVISGILLLDSLPALWMDWDLDLTNLSIRAAAFALAVALLVACLTTKPPRPQAGAVA